MLGEGCVSYFFYFLRGGGGGEYIFSVVFTVLGNLRSVQKQVSSIYNQRLIHWKSKLFTSEWRCWWYRPVITGPSLMSILSTSSANFLEHCQ